MRKVWLVVAPFVFAASVGCEDGPNQPFQPSPSGAGDQWNNGDSPPASASGGQTFDMGYPTTGATTVCSADLKRQRWGWMLQQPMIPPTTYAGLNMAKDDLWHGLKIEDAESAPPDPNQPGGGLCQSVPRGYVGGCPSGIGFCNGNYWGNNAEVNFYWNLATHLVDQITLNLGYQGAMTATSAAKCVQCGGAHTYVIKIGDVVKKDGQPFLMDWGNTPHLEQQITEIYNAMLYTFAPQAGIPYVESPNCHADGNCLVFNAQGQTIFGVRPLAIYFQGNSGVPQPALSTPVQMYNFSTRFMPYSNIGQRLTLDANGPVASGISRGALAKGPCGTGGACATGQACGADSQCHVLCQQKVGVSFADMKNNCIEVSGDTNIDTVNLNKVLYGLMHDFEHWTSSIMGVNQNFTSSVVAADPNRVVQDTDQPTDGDIAQDFTFDIRARGHAANDYNAKGQLDLRGSSMVYIEWVRLMLQDVNRIMNAAQPAGSAPLPAHTLGDAACVNGKFGPGCSGLEGLIIPGGARGNFAWDGTDPGANWDQGIFYFASILKPGDIVGGFCVDPGAFTDCSATNSPWDQAQKWVLRRLGSGNLAVVPSELRDRRYYFKWFAIAYLKYMKAYSHANPATRDLFAAGGVGPSAVAGETIDLESLFFDNNNQGVGNGFDKFEYVDREFIGKGQEGTAGQSSNWIPWDFEYGSDIIGGNQRYDNWYRRMDREEVAMYASMLTDKVNHTPGQENNVNITNLFGSSVLTGVWPSYQCAIGAGGDPGQSGCPAPPLDSTNMVKCTTNAACDGKNPCVGTCGAGNLCVTSNTWVNGAETVCGGGCNFATYPQTGCQKANQTCVLSSDGVTEACVDMRMDLNGASSPIAHPYLYGYPGAWTRTPFSRGHSPISVLQADKHPFIGAAHITIPNFAGGPYTNSPQLASFDGSGNPVCPSGWVSDVQGGNWCHAPLMTAVGKNPWTVPSFKPMTPWLENQPGVGFTFPIDGQHDQSVQSAQLDFTGVLETYLVDYIPWVDTAGKGANPSCASGTACNSGYSCNSVTKACEKSDGTIQILAIEAEDFLGSAFLCQDPHTGDVLGVRQYDSAQAILDWLAAHPGGWNPGQGAVDPSAQAACNIIVRQSPANNYVDYITSKTNGVKLSINQGSGQGRVTDIVVYDPGITQTP
jgi:hypothetical protein